MSYLKLTSADILCIAIKAMVIESALHASTLQTNNNKMIIDLIQDRKDGTIIDTSTPAPKGKVHITSEYSAKRFYNDVMSYGITGFTIATALDNGTEQDVKRTLCEYITVNDYNLELCAYVNGVEWLTN